MTKHITNNPELEVLVNLPCTCKDSQQNKIRFDLSNIHNYNINLKFEVCDKCNNILNHQSVSSNSIERKDPEPIFHNVCTNIPSNSIERKSKTICNTIFDNVPKSRNISSKPVERKSRWILHDRPIKFKQNNNEFDLEQIFCKYETVFLS